MGSALYLITLCVAVSLMYGQVEAQSCRARCGLYVEFAPCQCDPKCLERDNCCDDFLAECVDVRLVDGDSPNEGRVVLVLGSQDIGSICDEGWSIMDATVTCNQLGYPGASLRTMGPLFGSGNLPLIASTFLCSGGENKLTRCNFTHTGGYCPTGGAGGVICQKPGYQGCFGRRSSTLLLRDNPLHDPGMTGDVCIQHCARGRYELAAVRGRDCTCGLGIPIDSVYYHDYRCRMPCPGDNRQICGGYTEGRLMVYKTNTGFCRHPGNPSNGLRHGEYFRFGSKVKFTCFPGYQLEGHSEIQCGPSNIMERPIKTLSWYGIAPVCRGNETEVSTGRPRPAKRAGGVSNIIIGLVTVALLFLALLIIMLVIRLRRRMKSKQQHPAPLPKTSPPPKPIRSAAPQKAAESAAPVKHENDRPVYAVLNRGEEAVASSGTATVATVSETARPDAATVGAGGSAAAVGGSAATVSGSAAAESGTAAEPDIAQNTTPKSDSASEVAETNTNSNKCTLSTEDGVSHEYLTAWEANVHPTPPPEIDAAPIYTPVRPAPPTPTGHYAKANQSGRVFYSTKIKKKMGY